MGESNHNAGIENIHIKGITAKTISVIIICTASIVTSVIGTFYNLQGSINQIRYSLDSQQKIMDLRIQSLESRQKIIEEEILNLQNKKI